MTLQEAIDNKDGYMVHILSDCKVDIGPSPAKRLLDERMAQLKAEYEYNMNPDNIPTWASPELAFEMFKIRYKEKNPSLFTKIIRKIKNKVVSLYHE